MDCEFPIEVLTAVEGIRRRPAMYLGRALDDPLAATCLLRETFCLALDDVLGGCCSEIDVWHRLDGTASVADNGPGIPVTMIPDGPFSLEVLMTELHACRDQKKHRNMAHKLCGAGIVVASALSEHAAFDSFVDGAHWRQTFTRGCADGDPIRLGDADRMGKIITIKPDSTLIPNTEFDFDELATWLQSLDLEGAAVSVTLHQPDGATQTLFSTR